MSEVPTEAAFATDIYESNNFLSGLPRSKPRYGGGYTTTMGDYDPYAPPLHHDYYQQPYYQQAIRA